MAMSAPLFRLNGGHGISRRMLDFRIFVIHHAQQYAEGDIAPDLPSASMILKATMGLACSSICARVRHRIFIHARASMARMHAPRSHPGAVTK